MTFPFQVVAGEGAQPAWEEKDLADLGAEEQLEVVGEIFSAAAARGFDVEEGPLVRAALLRRSLAGVGGTAVAGIHGAVSLCLASRIYFEWCGDESGLGFHQHTRKY